jgi:protein O-mannosyl-transferase
MERRTVGSSLSLEIGENRSQLWRAFGPWARPWILAIVVVSLHAALLWPALRHDFVLDDAVYISENPTVTQGTSLDRYFLDRATVASDRDLQWQSYRPVRTLAFRAIVKFAGLHPSSFRIANLLLWLPCLFFLFRMLQRFGAGPRTCLAVGVLFAVAPVHIEPLVYPSAVGDVLSAALQLAAIDVVLVGWFEISSLSRRLFQITAALMLSFAALLVKESAVVTPFLLLLVAFELRKDPRLSKRRVAIDIGVQMLAVLCFLGARTKVLHAVGHAPTTMHSASTAIARLPWLLLNYAKICFAPLGHVPSYVVPTPQTWILVLAWLFVGVAGALVVWKASGWLRLGTLWFVVGLAPVLGLVPLAADMADRYALVSTFGLAFVGIALCQEADRVPLRRWLGLVTVLVAVLYAAGSVIEQAAWANDASIWEKSVVIEPMSSQAFRNLGLIRVKQGRSEEAVRLLNRSLELVSAQTRVHYYLAMAYENGGHIQRAYEECLKEVQLNPNFGRAQAIRGSLALLLGKTEEARRALSLAMEQEPEHPSVIMLDLSLARKIGDVDREIDLSAKLLQRSPADARFRYLRARALLPRDPVQSLKIAKQCVKDDPENPYCNAMLGRNLLAMGRPIVEASRYLQVALKNLPAWAHEELQLVRGLLSEHKSSL